MSSRKPGGQAIRRLTEIRNCFDRAAAQEKLEILHALKDTRLRRSSDLKRLHSTLCYLRAFPDSAAHAAVADALLLQFGNRVAQLPAAARTDLWDTGIVATPVHYRFSFEVASWMAQRMPGAVTIDWEELEDTCRLDELLEHIIVPAETDFFYSGNVDTREWLRLASAGTGVTDFDWLMAQLRQERLKPVWSQLYNAADLPLIWTLHDGAWAKSRNIGRKYPIKPRRGRMRKPAGSNKSEIERPVDSLQRVAPRAGARLIDIAMASLAVRHRETYHFNFANPHEVYVADVGEGVSIVVFGLQHKHRFPLECTMGFLILANGVPVGYGGSSIVFSQVNTGINIFDEYRGSEAAFLWIQVMRVYHQLVGCTRYIANPFQVGSGNDEALQSGAFWFYYRLGYRPVSAEIRKLAKREAARIRKNKNYRSSLSILRRLASCDMHLVLSAARTSHLFAERWLETSSMLATNVLASGGDTKRSDAIDGTTASVLRDLDIRSFAKWSAAERSACRRLAPIIAAAKPAAWPGDEKRSMRKLLRAKGGELEAVYARLLGKHDYFRSELKKACRNAESGRRG